MRDPEGIRALGLRVCDLYQLEALMFSRGAGLGLFQLETLNPKP